MLFFCQCVRFVMPLLHIICLMQANISVLPSNVLDNNKHLLTKALSGAKVPANLPAETTLFCMDEGQIELNLRPQNRKCVTTPDPAVLLLPETMRNVEYVHLSQAALPSGVEQFFSLKD